ncbi:hypothetical protein FOMPIDRAFT_1121748 [Fomitopsis schrenkii]|uniref:Uncharacterized protein n=1 Tax=Fomitopsis schrenkii TaxID=2126942 RepID=S8E858_FOMSC|nr:hypothetical protein FOMPIDRAFT_1121748 [Fomitopsis schrenkii]
MVFQGFFIALCALATTAFAKPNVAPDHSVVQTPLVGQAVAFACYSASDNGCKCPTDLTGDKKGVLINLYPGFQCAYTGGGACTYDQSGALQTTGQTECAAKVTPCGTEDSCECPVDLKGEPGILINHFLGYQCAYTHGACTWNYNGTLQNTAQDNCPTDEPCAPLA